MRFITKYYTHCGMKHEHRMGILIEGKKSGLLPENSIYTCCHCGSKDFTITHYPVSPPKGMGNWDDLYHLQCDKCGNECGMRELPNELMTNDKFYWFGPQ